MNLADFWLVRSFRIYRNSLRYGRDDPWHARLCSVKMVDREISREIMLRNAVVKGWSLS